MLQRIQSIYLLIVAIVSGGGIFLFPLYKAGTTWVVAQTVPWVLGLFLLVSVLALVSIFRYSTRKSQFMLGRFNIILNFILLGFFVYQSLMVSGETAVSEKGIGMFLPIVSIVFLVLANKAIKKDEALVKSVDRLR